jgi:hypothetical protein
MKRNWTMRYDHGRGRKAETRGSELMASNNEMDNKK